MIVDANVLYWTPDGMQSRPRMGGSTTRYIEVTEAERLLEEAHQRGVASIEQKLDDLKNEIRELRER